LIHWSLTALSAQLGYITPLEVIVYETKRDKNSRTHFMRTNTDDEIATNSSTRPTNTDDSHYYDTFDSHYCDTFESLLW